MQVPLSSPTVPLAAEPRVDPASSASDLDESTALLRSRHPLQSLEREHRVVMHLADALDDLACRLARDPQPRAVSEAALLARTFRVFVDGVHYEREEQVLLPFIARHGFDWNGEALASIRSAHRQERYLIAVLGQIAEQPGPHSRDSLRRLAATAAALAEDQRTLAMRQDIELFPEVTTRLDGQAGQRLSEQLSRFDDSLGGVAIESSNLVRRALRRRRGSERSGASRPRPSHSEGGFGRRAASSPRA